MAKPIWLTPAGSLGTVPKGEFYQVPLVALEPQGNQTVFFEVIAGDLPKGFSCDQAGMIAGIPTPDENSYNVESRFAVRAYTRQIINGKQILDSLADRTFTITVTGTQPPEFITPPGIVAQFYDGTVIKKVQIEFTDYETSTVKLVGGQLPPYLTMTKKGLISGYVDPLDQSESLYEFTLEVSNTSGSSLRTFAIHVFNRLTLTADNTYVTADNTFITADVSAFNPPVMLTDPGSIGTVPGDSFFAFQFEAIDPDNKPLRYGLWNVHQDNDPQEPVPGHIYYNDMIPPGLSLDPDNGWIMGYLEKAEQSLVTYTFQVYAYVEDDPYLNTGAITYSITIVGELSSQVDWLSPDYLGCIENGAVSTFNVKAVRKGIGVIGYGILYSYFPYAAEEFDLIPLSYRLEPGSYSSLPQGLELLPSGDISGRVSFNTFAFDGGTTTFDVEPYLDPVLGSCGACDCMECGSSCDGCASCNACPGIECSETTFDMLHRFTVNVQSLDGEVDLAHEFSILVKRKYNEPYENLYIEAMPPIDDRIKLDLLLKNDEIFPFDLIYRPTDPFFGVAKNVVYWHAYGLTSATREQYTEALDFNHYWKNLTLGQIKTARAVDSAGNVLYDVVYSDIVDPLVNNDGITVNKEVILPYAIEIQGFDRRADSTKVTADSILETADCAPCNLITGPCDPATTLVVYPNGLVDMREQVVDTIGQISSKLPLWMTSVQADGNILGYTPAWVIAYVKPGLGGQIAYNLATKNTTPLNEIDFKADRYELDHTLSVNWDPVLKRWMPPPEETTFDGDGFDLPLNYLGTVDYATTLPFIDINNSTIEYINSIGGIDGHIGTSLNQKKLIFVKQTDYVNPPNAKYPGPISDSLAWTDYKYPYDSDPYAKTLYDECVVIPGEKDHQIDPLIPNERMAIWRIVVEAGEIVRLFLEQETSTYDYVTVLNGTTYAYQELYVPSSAAEGNNVIDWQPLPTFTDTETTFDHNSLLFVQPVDMYCDSDKYNQYLLFPKFNIIDDLPDA